MNYFALILSAEPTAAPDPEAMAAGMAAYQEFHTRAAAAIRAGDALAPSAVGARVAGGPGAPTVTDGPFVEGAEIACGYYVFDAENLDDALGLARQIPTAHVGAVEVWPIAGEWTPPSEAPGNDWLALLLEAPDEQVLPGTPQWDECGRRHAEFGAAAGEHILAGAGLHPPSTATTVRVRDGQTLLSDGPYVEGAEVASGFYVLRAADRDEAIKLASMIPASAVELRQLAGVSGL
jgi:hypothetical protein